MIDFYSQGSNIGVALTGHTSLFIFLFLILSSALYSKTKVFPFHRFILFIGFLKSVRKIIPEYYRITLVGYFTTSKESKNCYRAFIKVRSRLDKSIWTCDWVEIDKLGRIIKTDLTKSIDNQSQKYKSEIKEFNRNKKIKELGL